MTIILEFGRKASNICLRRSSGVSYPRSSVGEGTFIEAAAFAGRAAHISLNLTESFRSDIYVEKKNTGFQQADVQPQDPHCA